MSKGHKAPEFFELWDEITGQFYGEYATLAEALEKRQVLIEANPHFSLTDDLQVFRYRSDGTVETVRIDV